MLKAKQVWNHHTAHTMLQLMKQVTLRGTGARIRYKASDKRPYTGIKQPVAGKTGTAQVKKITDKDKIYFQFTLDIEIPNTITNELLMLINIANQNSKEGFFVFDIKFWKIKYWYIIKF